MINLKGVFGSPKFYLGLAATVGTVAVLWYAHHAIETKERLRIELEQARASLERAAEVIQEERDARTEVEQRRTEYLTKVREAQNEAQKLRDCIADGTCGLRVNATCPTVPETSAGAPRTEGATAELTATARRDYLALREGLIRLEADFAWCQKELEARASPSQP